MILTNCLKCESKNITHICDKVMLETKTICLSCGNESVSRRDKMTFSDDLDILNELLGYKKKASTKTNL